MGCSNSSSKKEVYNNTNLPQEIRKISNKQLNLTPKATRERRINKTQSQQKEGNYKNQNKNKGNRDKNNRKKINETTSWFFEKIKKNLIKLQPDSSREKRERVQINKIRNEKRDVTVDTTEIQRIRRDYYKQVYANKMDNLEEMEKFLER